MIGKNLSRGAAAFLVCAAWSGAHAAGSHGRIVWDTYGIPHIYAPDLLSVVRGLGYAEMGGQAETLLTNAATARGRLAEYFGAGSGNANVSSDIAVRTEGIPGRAALWLATGGQFQRDIIQAFVDGANSWAAANASRLDPSFKRVLPLVPADITAGEQNTIHFTIMPQQDNIPALLSAWQSGGITAANALARSFTPTGSNGWAIAPAKSASGNAILMGNPHLPWGNNGPIPGLGVFEWMEVNLVIGDPAHPRLNASGVTFPGGPYIGIGYNDDLGWTHTNNTIQNVGLYQISIDKLGFYQFGALRLPVIPLPDQLKIRNPDGSFTTHKFTIYQSIQGPLVAEQSGPGGSTLALALRVAGLDKPSIVTEYWRMMLAHDLPGFIAANSMLQMPFFNVIYADRAGHVMYVFGGQQPRRPGGRFGDYDGVLDGGNPALMWTGTLAWNELPRAIDPPGGFVANSNNPPWTSTLPATPTNDIRNYPAWIAPSFMDMRAQNAAKFLESRANFTVDQLLTAKESTHMELADRVLPDLLLAATSSSDPTAQAAASVLSAWDRSADAASKGAVLFERWWNIVSTDPNIAKDTTDDFYSPHPQFRIGWSASSPLTTPVGLADPASCLSDLITAANQVRQSYGALDVAWGDVHRTVLVSHDPTYTQATPVANDPVSGPDDPFGPVRVVNPFPAEDGSNALWSYGGDGYVQLVEFTKRGAEARALLTYGNASRPGSPHITDQLPVFDAKTLRPAWRTQADVAAHEVSEETY